MQFGFAGKINNPFISRIHCNDSGKRLFTFFIRDLYINIPFVFFADLFWVFFRKHDAVVKFRHQPKPDCFKVADTVYGLIKNTACMD